MYKIIVSCIASLLSGYGYGLFFLYERKRVLFSHQTTMQLFIVPIVARIIIFGLFCYYLLLTPQIHFILTLLSFLTGFWSIILRKKAIFDGRL